MERLNQNELVDWLDDFKHAWSFYPKASVYKKGLMEQAYQQIRELILCKDMVQQYRDEMEAEQAEIELTYLDIVLDLYEQLEAKNKIHNEMKTGIHELYQTTKILKKS